MCTKYFTHRPISPAPSTLFVRMRYFCALHCCQLQIFQLLLMNQINVCLKKPGMSLTALKAIMCPMGVLLIREYWDVLKNNGAFPRNSSMTTKALEPGLSVSCLGNLKNETHRPQRVNFRKSLILKLLNSRILYSRSRWQLKREKERGCPRKQGAIKLGPFRGLMR